MAPLWLRRHRRGLQHFDTVAIGIETAVRLTEAELAAAPETKSVAHEADLRLDLMPLRQRLLGAVLDHPLGDQAHKLE
jgi:hypothetical protein